MKFQLTYHQQLILLFAFILGLFYPAVFAEICIVDDLGAINDILNSEGYNLKGVFFPGSTGGGYYRPFIALSYLLDKHFWLMSSQAMHLDNIIMHDINVLLVFILTRTLLDDSKKNSLIPLIAALIFGMNPIVSESVNWISGRTDLMAGNFTLLSAICIFQYRNSKSNIKLLIAILSIICAVLSKESALGFFPALLLIWMPSKQITEHSKQWKCCNSQEIFIFLGFSGISILTALFIGNYWIIILLGIIYYLVIVIRQNYQSDRTLFVSSIVKQFIVLVVVFSVAAGFFKLLRRVAFSTDIDKISQTLKLIFEDTNYALSLFLGAMAFYVKKFFLPLPLNFYIREIDPLYSLAGIILFFFCISLLNNRSNQAKLFLLGICMVIPVLPFAFGTIAWTAYAERYIYISSAFWTISVCICSSEYLDKREWLPNLYAKNHTLHICLFSLLMIMFFITFKRNLVWRKNIDIIGDTVSLTPEAKPLRGLYMLAYARSGNIFAAKQQYHIANSLYSLQYDEKFDINMASILIDEGDLLEAERYYLIVITKTRGKSLVALKGYLDLLDKSSTQQSNINKQILNIWDKQVDVCNKIYTIDKDPYMLFRLGQFYISANNHIEALENFSKVVKLSPPGSKYHTASLKIISKYSR